MNRTTFRRRFSPAPGVITCVLATLLMFGCSSGDESKLAPGKPAKPAAPVTVIAAEQKTVPVELHSVGQVEASATVTVRSQVAGVIDQIHFREGDEVRQGALLFTLDQRPFQAALAKAEADLEQARVAAQKADLDSDRFAQLLAAGFVSQDEAESVRSRSDSLRAAVAAGEASLQNARIQFGYASIRAPQAGRTGELRVHPGTVVKANDLPDLVTINALQPVRVGFSLPERHLPSLRQRLAAQSLEVQAQAPGDADAPEPGVVSFLDNRIDTASGTIRLKGTFANPANRLWPGQFVEVRLLIDTLENAVVVPNAAIQTGQQGSYLFVVKADNSAELRPVTTGVSAGDTTVILTGLAPGETVVTSGQQRLAPGTLIQVKPDVSRPQTAQP